MKNESNTFKFIGIFIGGLIVGFILFYIFANLNVRPLNTNLSYTPISSILSSPQTYVGRVVTVKGQFSKGYGDAGNTTYTTAYGGYLVDYNGNRIYFYPTNQSNQRTFYILHNYSVTGTLVRRCSSCSSYDINATSITRLD